MAEEVVVAEVVVEVEKAVGTAGVVEIAIAAVVVVRT